MSTCFTGTFPCSPTVDLGVAVTACEAAAKECGLSVANRSDTSLVLRQQQCPSSVEGKGLQVTAKQGGAGAAESHGSSAAVLISVTGIDATCGTAFLQALEAKLARAPLPPRLERIEEFIGMPIEDLSTFLGSTSPGKSPGRKQDHIKELLRRRSVGDWYGNKTPTNAERRSKVSSMDWYLDGDRRPSTRTPFTECYSLGQESFDQPSKAAEKTNLVAVFGARSPCDVLMLSLDPTSVGKLLEASHQLHRILTRATRREVAEAIADAGAEAASDR